MHKLIAEVLAAWREAERVAADATTTSEREAAGIAAARLQALYQELAQHPNPGDDGGLRNALELYRVHPPEPGS